MLLSLLEVLRMAKALILFQLEHLLCLLYNDIFSVGWGVMVLVVLQANPPDPKSFPFILLGNKIDIDGGNSRVVS